MWIEKKLKAVSPRLLAANGTQHGLVQVADIKGFFVKQKVYLQSATQPALLVEIKRFESLNSFYVGPLPPEGGIQKRTNISVYLVADGAFIRAEEQERPGIKPDEHERAVYVEEPIVAKRVISVDEYGNYYNKNNPVPTEIVDSVGLAPADFDEVIIDRDAQEDPVAYNFFKNSMPVGVVEVTYNQSKSSVKYKRTS